MRGVPPFVDPGLARLRAADVATGRDGAAPPAIAAPAAQQAAAARGFVDALKGRKFAREADAFWAQVRDAVEAAMGERGPMPAHAIYRAPPAELRRQGESVGLPLTPG
ncbi:MULTISPECIES: hypothetical protein [Methylobacterium]|jgi:hypothetical protein|uniref:hypothetical protein n=1 Tax=Methylobacterium TaxID=407 RepID=UPI002381AFFA|nr:MULTISPECIES: hypothetical protein [Methylobacterium]MDE4909466.1 hypothetical protein [Methylobacterium sp. 092160098-2]MDH2308488.1 hypothetical protein [Methylobacterium brachiatum]